MAWDRVSLADAMIARLDEDEIDDLCFRLQVDDQNLDRKTKGRLVRSLIKYMEQREQFDVLTRKLGEMRPDIKPPQQPSLPLVPTDKETPARPVATLTAPALGDRMTDPRGVTMVYVPPGKFMMGSADITDDEKPPHEVTISRGFWLDLMPVTNAMYNRFVRAGGYVTRDFWTNAGWEWTQKNGDQAPADYEGFVDLQQPRVGVTWFEVDAYCRWRGGRLPTEAEWEWAARGPKSLRYPWGNEMDAKRAVFKNNSSGKTARVNGNTRLDGASWVGVLDMSGNVWEWLSTLFWPYPYNAEDGRESLEDAETWRGVRGGSWSYDDYYLQAAYRRRLDPAYASPNYGFRCARSL